MGVKHKLRLRFLQDKYAGDKKSFNIGKVSGLLKGHSMAKVKPKTHSRDGMISLLGSYSLLWISPFHLILISKERSLTGLQCRPAELDNGSFIYSELPVILWSDRVYSERRCLHSRTTGKLTELTLKINLSLKENELCFYSAFKMKVRGVEVGWQVCSASLLV